MQALQWIMTGLNWFNGPKPPLLLKWCGHASAFYMQVSTFKYVYSRNTNKHCRYTLWYFLFLHCGTFCFYIVVLFVSTLWYFLFLHCGTFCFYIVALIVSTLWYFLFLHCGTFCFYIVALFVSALWHFFVSTLWYFLFVHYGTFCLVPQCRNKKGHNVETKSTTM
jgi:hypothetical protein